MNLSKFKILLIITLSPILITALNHSGTITGFETWYFSDSPHIITGTVTITNTGNLTIESGCEVKFDNARYISVYGVLDASGTYGMRITFTRNGSVEWSGLHFQSNSIGDLQYCTIEYATNGTSNGIYANATYSLSIDECTIRYNDNGFYGNNVTPILTNNTFQNNTTGIFFQNSTSANIGTGNTVSANTTGIKFYNCSYPGLSSGNTIQNNTSCGIFFENCSNIGTVDSQTLNNNNGYGAFRFTNCGDFTLGNSNVYSNNNYPLTIDTGSFPAVGSYIPTSGNTNNDIRVTSGAGTKTGTWNYFSGLDYIITESPTINSAGNLTIADGNTVKFNSGRNIYVYGTLTAAGTPGNGISFTRNGTAEWSGLQFLNNSTVNLQYCTIEYASYGNSNGIYTNSATSLSISNCNIRYNDTGFYGDNTNPTFSSNTFQYNTTGIYIQNSSSPNLTGNSVSSNSTGIQVYNCTSPEASSNYIESNTNCGIFFDNCSSIATLNSITLNNNNGYGAFRFKNCGDFTIGNFNTYSNNNWPLTIDTGSFPSATSNIPASGNTNNNIRVTSGASTKTGTWNYFSGLDYIITESPTINSAGNLTIADGNTIKFNNGRNIYVYGTLTALSSVAGGITFTRNGTVDWSGLQFLNNSTGNLQYCTIEYATYGTSNGIYGYSPTSLTVDNCLIQNNDYGFLGDNITPTLTNNTFQNNTTGIYIQSSTSPNIGSGNTLSSNTTGIRFYNCTAPSISTGNTVQSNTNCGIFYDNCSSLGTIDSITLSNNNGYGAFCFQNSGDFTLGSSNTFSNNNWPLTIDIGSFPAVGSYIPTSGNTNNDIRVTSGAGTKTGTWNLFSSLDYIITDSPTINAGGSVTIADGNNIKFDNARIIYIYGTLNAAGTSGNGITFTRNGSVEWGGLQFLTNSTGNLQYCTIEYATYGTSNGIYGNAPYSLTVNNCNLKNNDYGFYGNNLIPTLTNNTFQNNTTGIYIQSSTSPGIGSGNAIFSNTTGVRFYNCTSPTFATGDTIRNNSSCGIFYDNCSSIGTISSITTTYNNGYGAYRFQNCGDFTMGTGNVNSNNEWPLTIDAGSFPAVGSAIPAAGNTNNDIRVTSGNGTKTGTWNSFFSLDYIVTDNPTLNSGGSLTIAAGNTIKFNSARAFYIYGTLNAAGNSGNGVFFTRNGSVRWSGLQFLNNSFGNLQYSTIEYADYGTSNGIYANSVSSLTLNNCLLQNNDYGFYAINCSPSFASNNKIIDNNEYGIYLTGNCYPTFGSSLSQWNDIYGNGTYDLRNGTADITAGYVYWGTTSESQITSQIYDKNDNASLGTVTYEPWTDSSHSQTYGQGPTPVILTNFTISVITATNVQIEWTTQSEINNSGWNIFRGESEDAFINDEVQQINSNLIPGSGTVSQPTDYNFSDYNNSIPGNKFLYWLESLDFSGVSAVYGPISIIIPYFDENPEFPFQFAEYGLHQKYPNPFGCTTTISFLTAEGKENAEIEIYNIKGEKIKTLDCFNHVETKATWSHYSRIWDGKDKFGKPVSSGIYYYKLITGEDTFMKKMIKLR